LSDEADGYVTEVTYTRHHHPTLDPARAVLAARRAGLEPPSMRHACELGFGQGLSLAIHATASDTEWWGVDVLPQHVEFARSLIDDVAARERLVCASFEQFDALNDLPDFDFIALHGVWSWVSPENRARITAFIDRRLAPGGIVYLGYNALPGWGPALSLRELLVAHARSSDSLQRPLQERIERALEFATQVVACDPKLLASQPQFEKHLRDIRTQKTAYLAHEYFNRDWHPMHFAQVAAELLPLGLTYLGQADYSDSYDQWRLNDAQQALLADIEDPLLRETTRDIILDRRFRRDYWVRSEPATAISSPSRLELRLWVPSAIRSADTETPDAVIEWFRSLGAPGAIVHRSIETAVEHAALGYALGRGWVELVREQILADTQRTPVSTINRRILDRVHHDPEMSVLASHLTGSGVELGWWTLALLAAMRAGLSGEGVVDQVIQQSDRLGLVLSRRGFALTPEEMRDELGLRYADLLARSDEWGAAFVI
jgi:SAM-dependent methyltransferase